MAKTSIDKLGASIENLLAEYGDELQENIDEITVKVGKAGVTALRNQSKQNFGGTGKYAKGWRSEVDKTRLGTTVTLYNQTPGLPHLLEHGHAKRTGGRVEGKPHIAPVESKLIKQYETEVLNNL